MTARFIRETIEGLVRMGYTETARWLEAEMGHYEDESTESNGEKEQRRAARLAHVDST